MDKLDKILYNLLSNAAKYNKEDGFIQVSLSYDETDKDFVLLKIKDNGKGISKEKQKNLFKRFYEGDYRKFNTIGTGIGLSLTKDLVELHGSRSKAKWIMVPNLWYGFLLSVLIMMKSKLMMRLSL